MQQEIAVLLIVGGLVAAFAIWMAMQIRQEGRRIDRQTRHLCPGCGYDMRGTPQRCPECGLEYNIDDYPALPLDQTVLVEDWPASPLQVRQPLPGETLVVVHCTKNVSEATTLCDQLEARGIRAERRAVDFDPLRGTATPVSEATGIDVVVSSGDLPVARGYLRHLRRARRLREGEVAS